MVANLFVPAVKEATYVKALLAGPSGSGKTWTALLLAEEIARLADSKIAVIDTEGRSARKYSDRFTFDVFDVSKSYDPNVYRDAIKSAEANGYAVIVIDSFSHAWNGAGGVLEIVDKAGKKMGGNDFAGWSKGRPAQNSLVQAVVEAQIHIIGTARAKTEWVMTEGKGGRTKPEKIGMTAVQSSEFEYEFDLSVMMGMDHQMEITKSRCQDIPAGETFSDTDFVAGTIYAWATDGVEKPTITAGNSYLGTEAGRVRLTKLFDDHNVQKDLYPYLLSNIEPGKALGGFSETTLSEDELHQRIADLMKAKQGNKTQSGIFNLDQLRQRVANSVAEMSDVEMANLAGVKSVDRIEQEFEGDFNKAFEAIHKAFDDQMANTPPATPKRQTAQPDPEPQGAGLSQDDIDTILVFADNLGATEQIAQSWLDLPVGSWDGAPPLQACLTRLKAMAIQRNSTFLKFKAVARPAKNYWEAIVNHEYGEHALRVRFYSRDSLRTYIDNLPEGSAVREKMTELVEGMEPDKEAVHQLPSGEEIGISHDGWQPKGSYIAGSKTVPLLSLNVPF